MRGHESSGGGREVLEIFNFFRGREKEEHGCERESGWLLLRTGRAGGGAPNLWPLECWLVLSPP